MKTKYCQFDIIYVYGIMEKDTYPLARSGNNANTSVAYYNCNKIISESNNTVLNHLIGFEIMLVVLTLLFIFFVFYGGILYTDSNMVIGIFYLICVILTLGITSVGIGISSQKKIIERDENNMKIQRLYTN